MKGVIDKKYRNIAIYSIVALGLGITILLFFITAGNRRSEDTDSEDSNYSTESDEIELESEWSILADSINRSPIHAPWVETKKIEQDTSDCESVYYSVESWNDKNSNAGLMDGEKANITEPEQNQTKLDVNEKSPQDSKGMLEKALNIPISIASYIYFVFNSIWNPNESSHLDDAAENNNNPPTGHIAEKPVVQKLLAIEYKNTSTADK
ncbi:hypothetical protein NEIG_02492 [Nematocida sp. ERTm5]|nr:hypothetical protein NEIG_02492 [Nematocida sp. ERTm5]